MNWIVTEMFYPDEVSTALIMTEISRKKAELGDVSVICGPSGYEKSYGTQELAIDRDINIYRLRIPKLNKNKIVPRIFRLILLTIKMGWAVAVKVKKNDDVLIVTNPAFLLILVSLIRKVKGFQLSVLVHDVFPENLVPAGIMKSGTFQYSIISSIYNYAYAGADSLIVLGEDMKQLMLKKLGSKAPLIKIIPNWSDTEIMPMPDFDSSEYYSIDIKDRIVLGFAGNLGRVQGLIEFVKLFKQAANPLICLIIVGDGALQKQLREIIESENIDNVYLVGSRPRSQQVFFLNACHIALITLKEGMKGLGVPSKTYNVMAAAKPIMYIGDPQSEVDNYISDYHCGWSYEWRQETQIINFLKSLSSDKLEEIKNKGQKSLEAAQQNFSKDMVLNKYLF